MILLASRLVTGDRFGTRDQFTLAEILGASMQADDSFSGADKRIPCGIRCVIAVGNPEQRAAIVHQLRCCVGVVVVGQTDDPSNCEELMEEFLPELLIGSAALLDCRIANPKSRWPVVLKIGGSAVEGERLTVPEYEAESFRSALGAAVQRVLVTKVTELRDLTENYLNAIEAPPLSAFTVVDNGRERTIPSEEVRFITVDGNYAKLHTGRGQFRVRETLNNLANSLDPHRFARIHRSIIVNLSFVDRVLTTADRASSLVLRDRTHLPIGPSFSIPCGLAG